MGKNEAKAFLDILQEDHDATIKAFKEAETSCRMLDFIDMLPGGNEQETELTTLTRRYAEMCMGIAAQRHDDLHMIMDATVSLSKEMDEKNV